MYKLHLSTLKYTGVHRFIDLSNHPNTPWKFAPLDPPTPLELPVTFHGGGMDIFWNYTFKNEI